MKIAICGSTRYNNYIYILSEKLKEEGNDVRIPSDVPFPLSKSPVKQIANKLAYEMVIKNCELVLIFNANDYTGVSTLLELGMAIYLRKNIKILFPTTKFEFHILSASPRHNFCIDIDFIKNYLDSKTVDYLSIIPGGLK